MNIPTRKYLTLHNAKRVLSLLVICVILFNIGTSYLILPTGGTSMQPTLTCGVSIIDQEVNTFEEDDIVVFKTSEEKFDISYPILIQHRIIDKNMYSKNSKYNLDSKILYITKGDNNRLNDGELLSNEEIVGDMVRFYRYPKPVCKVVNPIHDFISNSN